MKEIIFLFFVLFRPSFANDLFVQDAVLLASDLKSTLVKELKSSIEKSGIVAAVNFCHLNVSQITKEAAGKRISQYEFGRTSHKVRNLKNHPEKWMESYVDEFKNLKQNDEHKKFFVHTFENGKKAYLEPIWTAPICLSCHGSTIPMELSTAIFQKYPNDQARHFNLNDFRGFIWIKQK